MLDSLLDHLEDSCSSIDYWGFADEVASLPGMPFALLRFGDIVRSEGRGVKRYLDIYVHVQRLDDRITACQEIRDALADQIVTTDTGRMLFEWVNETGDYWDEGYQHQVRRLTFAIPGTR